MQHRSNTLIHRAFPFIASMLLLVACHTGEDKHGSSQQPSVGTTTRPQGSAADTITSQRDFSHPIRNQGTDTTITP